jgi:hypothetical protein
MSITDSIQSLSKIAITLTTEIHKTILKLRRSYKRPFTVKATLKNTKGAGVTL